MDIIAVGEPGCYVTPGHVDVDAFTTKCQLEFGEEPLDYWAEDHEPARHTWMLVRRDLDEWGEIQDNYREVRTGVPGAEPYTLIACIGYWEVTS